MLGEAKIVVKEQRSLQSSLTTTESAGANRLSDGREPKVAIVVLNWNGKRDTVECLASLNEIDYSNYEILLVDNGSTDGSQKYFRAQYPEIELIENEMNLGFAEGNNVGIRHAMNGRADYVLLLNNDTFVHPKFLSELARCGGWFKNRLCRAEDLLSRVAWATRCYCVCGRLRQPLDRKSSQHR